MLPDEHNLVIQQDLGSRHADSRAPLRTDPHSAATSSVVQPLDILWIDLTVGLAQAELPEGFSQQGNITYFRPAVEGANFPLLENYHCVIVDFDYPDSRSLRLVQELKRSHPSVPFLLLTLQHSERFAIWSFRAKMWDFMVKPSSASEVARCFLDLRRVLDLSETQEPRQLRMPAQQIPTDASAPAPSSDEVSLQPVLNYVEKNFRGKLMVGDVARVCRMSPFRFSRLFKQQYAKTFPQYVTDFRLDEACRLLRSPNAVVTDVCYATGFNDASYFTKVFRNRYGVVPSAIVGIADAVLNIRSVAAEENRPAS